MSGRSESACGASEASARQRPSASPLRSRSHRCPSPAPTGASTWTNWERMSTGRGFQEVSSAALRWATVESDWEHTARIVAAELGWSRVQQGSARGDERV